MDHNSVSATKLLSVLGAGVHQYFALGILQADAKEGSDYLRASLLIFYSISFGLNLVIPPKVVSIVVIVLHTVGAIVVVGTISLVVGYTFGESGSKEGWLRNLVGPVFLLTTFWASTGNEPSSLAGESLIWTPG